MTLDRFEYVVAIAEEKSLTKAAKRLYISQPGLTAYVNKLERHLGAKLFDRSVTPIQITEAGKYYISKMKEIQKDEAVLLNVLRDMGSPKRVFRIGMGATRGMQWLPILLPAFKKLHPEVTIQIHEGGLQPLEDGVSAGELDVAFGCLSGAYPDIQYNAIAEEVIYCVVPRTEECVGKFGPEEATVEHPVLLEGTLLTGLTFLMPTPSNGFYQFTGQTLRHLGIQPGDTLSVTNLDVAYQLAGRGYGALLINAREFHCRYPELDDKLAFCMLTDPPACRQSLIAYQEQSPNLDLVQDLKRVIVRELQPTLFAPAELPIE